MHVKYVIYKTPKSTNYIFAIDHTGNRKQRKLIRSISKGIGGGKVEKCDITELTKKKDNYESFTLDLWMKPSKIFDEVNEEEGDDAPPPDDEEGEEELDETGQPKNKLRLKFDWRCKGGMTQNIKELCKEFNDYRSLKPNRIFITGPPCCGKSSYARK